MVRVARVVSVFPDRSKKKNKRGMNIFFHQSDEDRENSLDTIANLTIFILNH